MINIDMQINIFRAVGANAEMTNRQRFDEGQRSWQVIRQFAVGFSNVVVAGNGSRIVEVESERMAACRVVSSIWEFEFQSKIEIERSPEVDELGFGPYHGVLVVGE